MGVARVSAWHGTRGVVKMKQAGQAPNLTHANAATICAMALKAMGLDARRGVDFRDGYDFLVNEKVRIAVRYAIPTADREQTYRKRNGEVSRYVYKRWTFNFHRHGELGDRYCDFFVCFLASADTKARGSSDVSVFVIPWEAITGLTFCSSVREGSTRSYRGKYAQYRDAWNLIEHSAERPAAAHDRKRLKISADSRRRLRLVAQDTRAAGVREVGAGDIAGDALALVDPQRERRSRTRRSALERPVAGVLPTAPGERRPPVG
jgi:hypothetical protein